MYVNPVVPTRSHHARALFLALLPLALVLATAPSLAHAASTNGLAHAGRNTAAPSITAQPASIVVTAGSAATFSVVATSSTAISYQWTRGGTAITGATGASFTIAATQLSDNGAIFAVKVTNSVGTTTSTNAYLTVNAVTSSGASATRLFSDQSLWNARPTQFTLGNYQIPTSSYFPYIGTGPYSVTGVVATATDPAVTVVGANVANGVWVPDAEVSMAQVVIPHWPAGVTPAAGADGHADIIDPSMNRIHSFWQLSKDSVGQWHAAQYTWTPIDGTGWGTPGEYMQGSRAAGVVPIAGLIRASEVDDGRAMYAHALAMSLTYNGLSASPTSVFPATSADWDAATANTGGIPEGARLFLPTSFNLGSITDAKLLKVVKTLQTYGAYVVDRNYGTPYVIYVENTANFSLMPNGWDNNIAAQLDLIRAALRPVAAVSQWVDANGTIFTPVQKLNVMSMRGPWTLSSGPAAGWFDTWQQAVVFPSNGQKTVQVNNSGRSMPWLQTTPPTSGQQFRLTVQSTGGAQLQLTLDGMTRYFDSGVLNNGDSIIVTWPSSWAIPSFTAISGPTGGGSVGATMVPL